MHMLERTECAGNWHLKMMSKMKWVRGILIGVKLREAVADLLYRS